MIKQYNLQLVQNLLQKTNAQIKTLFILQLLSSFCSCLFIAWQIPIRFKMHSIIFTFLWVSVEVAVLACVNHLKKKCYIGSRIITYESKKGIAKLITDYTTLRYIKFLGLLCNFLGIVGAIKSMRLYGEIQWSALICLLCLLLCYQWLKTVNCLLDHLKKSLEIYHNFQMVVETDSEQQNMQEML